MGDALTKPGNVEVYIPPRFRHNKGNGQDLWREKVAVALFKFLFCPA